MALLSRNVVKYGVIALAGNQGQPFKNGEHNFFETVVKFLFFQYVFKEQGRLGGRVLKGAASKSREHHVAVSVQIGDAEDGPYFVFRGINQVWVQLVQYQ